MIRRTTTTLALLVVGVLVLTLASAAWLAGTESGTRWLLRQGLAYAPAEAGFTRVEGTLFTAVRLSDVSWRDGDLRVTLAELNLDPDWSALLHGRLRLQALTGQGLTVQLPDAESSEKQPPADPGNRDTWPVITLPFSLALSRLELRNIRIQQGANRHDFTRLALAGHWRGRQLELDYLALQQRERHLTLAGELTFAEPWRIDTRVAWGLPLPSTLDDYFDKPLAFGQGRLRGRVTELNVDHQLHRPRSLHSKGKLRLLDQPLHLDLEHEWPAQALNLPDGRRLALGAGRLQTRGAPDDYELELDAGASTLEGLPPLTSKLRAQGDLESLRIRELLLEGEPGRLAVDGAVAWQPQLDWSLALDGRDLDPAFLDARMPGRLALRAQLDGRLPADDPLALSLDLERLEGEVRGETVSASGQANMTGTEEIRIQTLQLHTRHGRARISGSAGWVPHINWSLDVAGTDWNPALLDERLPGRIHLNAHIAGELPPQAPPELDLNLRELDGSLREQSLSGGGELYAKGLHRVRGRMQLELGNNSVILGGQRAEQSDLELQLDAPELAALWPELAGSLKGRVRLRGTRSEPVLDGTLQGRDLALAPWRLEQLELTLRPPDEQGQQRLSLHAGEARRDHEILFSGLELDGRGQRSSHRLDWAVERADHRLAATLDGGLNDGSWQGRLEQLRLSGPLSQSWQQAQPAGLNASTERFHLNELCLQARDHGGRACAHGDWQAPDQGNLDLSLTGVPLAPFAAFLPPGTGLEGSLNGTAEMALRAGQPQGQAELTTGQGALLLGAGREEPIRVPWQQFSARARLAEGEWRLDTRLQRSETDFVDGHVAGELAPSNGQLEGRLETRLTDLSWLELAVPRVRKPEGTLDGTLALSGTTENPVFDGRMALRDARVRIPEAGLVLRRMYLTASTSDQGRLHFDGGAHSGDGQVQLNGRLKTDEDWPWPLQLHLEGRQFLALDRPDARLVLDPALDFTLEGRRLSLRGDMGVPAARFAPRELGGQAVQVSSDVHLVHQEEETRPPWKTDIDVGVTLGDDVRFQGFGLQARFGGEVRYRDPEDQVPRMTGEVRVEEGRYRAYGQRLQIERGRLLFEGAPDNPGLDIIAVRPLPNRETRVGLEVGGTLQEPNARVFSEPALEQSEAMALLLTGRSLSGTSRAESNAILQAVTRYGLERGEFLTNPLSETLGVDVGVDSSNELDRTALTLGKQLSERLYVQYSMGLFESLSTVMLRYSITSRLSLETRSSGESQGADLIYRLQAD